MSATAEKLSTSERSIIDIARAPEEIIRYARTEVFRFGEFPIAGAISHWGTRVSNADLVHALQTRGIEQDEEFFAKAGFQERSIYPTNLSGDEQALIEYRIGIDLLTQACIARGVHEQDLAALYVCNTIPGNMNDPYDTYGEDIATAVGATNAHVTNVSLACNAFVESMRQVGLQQNALRGQFVGVVCVEGLTKSIGDWHNGSAENNGLEPSNVGTFTNGGAATVWQVGEDFTITPAAEMMVVPDDIGVLRAPTTYHFEPNCADGLMRTPYCIRQQIPPIAGRHAFMDPTETARWGVREVPNILSRYIDELKPQLGPDGKILFLSHYPSEGMIAGVLKRLRRAEIPFDPVLINAPRLVPDGNCSSGVFPQVLLRAGRAGLLTPSTEAMCFGFGVGANFSAMKIQLPDR